MRPTIFCGQTNRRRLPCQAVPTPDAYVAHRTRALSALGYCSRRRGLLFAFLLSSFVASNSPVWLHLAAGRRLAQGEWPYGVAPFREAEPAPAPWLFDLGLYALYRLGGGAAAIVGKASLIAVLAGLLLGRPRALALCLLLWLSWHSLPIWSCDRRRLLLVCRLDSLVSGAVPAKQTLYRPTGAVRIVGEPGSLVLVRSLAGHVILGGRTSRRILGRY